MVEGQERKTRSVIAIFKKSLRDKSLSKNLIAVIGILLVSCGANAPQTGGSMAVPVPIASVESGTVTDSSDYVA